MNKSLAYALGAAVLFGVSTPFAKYLLDTVAPVLLAGLLYLGSGIGLAVIRMLRDRGWQSPALPAGEWPWLLGAIAFGGIAGPVALLLGLRSINGSTASLLLNLEAVLTALIAWLVFRESTDRRIVLGMAAIVAGGVVLSWPVNSIGTGGGAGASPLGWTGALLVALACACWAIDNNLTRKVSASDALFIAASKGLIAGAVNTALAWHMGAVFPPAADLLPVMAVGLCGYGVSLVLFVLALRELGTARTGAYFSTAPFIGAAVSLLAFGEAASWVFWLAAGLMGLGVWLHLSEHHAHEHQHEALEHTHHHTHDAHHQHAHDFEVQAGEWHTHAHRHAPLVHSHRHYPDIHHQHSH